MPAKQPLVSVIIPCRNEVDYIEQCLRAVVAQERPAAGYEVIIADGMSNDGTRAVLTRFAREFPFIKVVDNPARTTPVALNRAIAAAKGEIIVCMGVHADYAPDYVVKCVQTLEETKAEVVGGPSRAKGRGYFGKAIALAHNCPLCLGGAANHDEKHEGPVDTVVFGCWRRQFLEEIGMFDEELVRDQDDELNLRIARNGGTIWQSPEINSWYYTRSTVKTLFAQQCQYGYWKVRVIQKHRFPASLRHLAPGGFLFLLCILGCLSPVHWYFLLGVASLLGLYATGNLFASLLACRKPRNWKYLPVMPIVLWTYHFGYGYGFLRGVLDFVLRRRRKSETFSKLTRDRGSK